MVYPQRDSEGKIIGGSKHPNELHEETPIEEDSQEWLDYLKPIDTHANFSTEDLSKEENDKYIEFLKSNNIFTEEKATQLKIKKRRK